MFIFLFHTSKQWLKPPSEKNIFCSEVKPHVENCCNGT